MYINLRTVTQVVVRSFPIINVLGVNPPAGQDILDEVQFKLNHHEICKTISLIEYRIHS